MTRFPTTGPGLDSIRMFGITKDYGKSRALDSVDLSIAAGEFLTLLGPSGSGKSTLLMTLAGFVEPTDGNIFLGNRSILSLRPEKRDFGVVFQGYALFPHMTVAENLAYPLTIRRRPRAEIQEKVKQTLDLVQLGHLAERHPGALSGGQQQRVALGRALIFSPKVLLLDEPMGALDKNLRHDLQIELRQLHRRLGTTFVNVTHDQEEAMAMSDRIAIMRAGRIEQVGPPRDLYEMSRNRFVASFLGKSNFLAGTVAGTEAGVTVVDTADGPVRHILPSAVPAPQTGSAVLLALRPQKVLLGSQPNNRPARVVAAVFLGTHAELTLRCPSGQDLVAQVALDPTAALPAEGEEVEVGWDPASTALLDAG